VSGHGALSVSAKYYDRSQVCHGGHLHAGTVLGVLARMECSSAEKKVTGKLLDLLERRRVVMWERRENILLIRMSMLLRSLPYLTVWVHRNVMPGVAGITADATPW